MTSLLWERVYEKRPQEILSGEVEFDEFYLVAGHKGKPCLAKKKRKSRRRRLKGKPGRGTAADDKPLVLGMI